MMESAGERRCRGTRAGERVQGNAGAGARLKMKKRQVQLENKQREGARLVEAS